MKKNILTIIFPTSRIDAAIPEKTKSKGSEGEREKRSSESRDTLGEVGPTRGSVLRPREPAP